MKRGATTLLLVLFSLVGIDLSAQVPDSTKTKEYRWSIGIGLPLTVHRIFYKDSSIPDQYRFSAFSAPEAHVVYRFNKRASLQGGIGYMGNTTNYQSTGMPNDGSGRMVIVDESYRSRTSVLTITGRFNLVNVNKRLPIYTIATLMPAYGTYRQTETWTHNNETTTQKDVKLSGVNMFAMAGFGFSYRTRKRLSGTVDVLLFRRNLTPNLPNYSRAYLIERYLIQSFSFGFNYGLR
ncbi:hypothetical protein [Rufibacter tibetensis]|uniref:Outer membrane protein beta-barrel domain-containing protein n=1 Tax=Rufibacter tibetensis TaxID=512763 RepID=A0A0P0CZP5_9BACT|nr:hypothetical protein [Rufibacter tibetensis]ALJ00012.1 hypothetical protein DC20_14790 [Rufibacter tibetensis]